ncbi:MAG: DUF5615 family PIN-like protein [Planctomycetota bacterium]
MTHVVRLLFDENLSHRLVARLASPFPDSVHVRTLGLLGGQDGAVWAHAAAQGLTIVTKDDDFRQMSFLRGAPPKVIWLVVGNGGTSRIAKLLEQRRDAITDFVQHPTETLLVLRSLHGG